MSLPFWKYEGTGNDFVVLDAGAAPAGLDWATLAPLLCDRHRGIGADGVLLLGPGEAAPLRMRVLNADGSEPEMCGNGIRCAMRWWADQGRLAPGLAEIETLAGLIRAELVGVDAVRVGMGRPRWLRGEIPTAGEAAAEFRDQVLGVEGEPLTFTAVSMGNPHAVCVVPAVDAVPLTRWGPVLEHHPAFPARTNVEFLEIVDAHRARMIVWERGAGVTLACGTGACAALVVAARAGLLAREATITLPGGALRIEWDATDEVWMTGPARPVFTGTVEPARLVAAARVS